MAGGRISPEGKESLHKMSFQPGAENEGEHHGSERIFFSLQEQRQQSERQALDRPCRTVRSYVGTDQAEHENERPEPARRERRQPGP